MAEERKFGDRVLRVGIEDITLTEVDAFVYYARPDLVLGAGFGNAITVRGGPSIQKELAELGSQETGAVVLTGAGELKAKHILHAVGPRFQEPDMEEKLRATIRRVFGMADENGFQTLALPPMGAGFYGFPLPDCARVMIEECERHLTGDTTLEEVRICCVDKRDATAFGNLRVGETA